MSTRMVSRSLFTFGYTLILGSCVEPDLSQPCAFTPGASAAQSASEFNECVHSASLDVAETRRDIDILFMIDNSASMSPKQKVLAQNIPRFIQKIDATGADYHVGIVTSDVGALPASGAPPAGWGNSRCDTVAGDDGHLQALPCTSRTQNVSTEFSQACTSLCADPSYVPQNGQSFISKEGGIINVKSKKDGMGNEIGPQLAFQCMALVGDGGCGVEGQLEAAKRALDPNRNPGFLRNGSVLGVIFITDEDDCSVQLSQRMNNNPADMSCTPGNFDAAASCYNLDYRCLARSVECTESMDTPGAKSNCVERPNNYLEPLSTYARFFAAERQTHPLVLGGIWAPSLLDYQAGNSSDGKLIIASENPPAVATNQLNRGRKTEAACYNPDSSLTSDPNGFFGQAQLRLSSFIRKFDTSVDVVEKSICDVSSYSATLDRIADLLIKKPLCLANRPKVVNDAPVCLVGYVDANQPTASPDSYLPQCSSTCCQGWASSAQPTTDDPGIQAACAAEKQDCFCAEPNDRVCASSAVAGVWRPGNVPPPSGKAVNFRCASTQPPAASIL